MVERRSPLVLSSTRATLRSVLNSFRPDEIPGRPDSIRRSVRLPAGVLRWKRDGVNDSKFDSLDDSSLVGLSTQLLKRLSINSGSFVVINNIDIGIQRVAQVVVLDPPNKTLEDSSVTSLPVSDSLHTMLVFPTFDTMSQQLLDQEVAYLSPMLAFNLSLHMSCLKSLVHRGNEVLEKYFVAKFDEESASVAGESKIGLDLEPVSEVPGYASHLRVSFVKIPECGTIQSLVVSSSFEDEERQGLIDSALNKYFGTDRVLSRGDVFRVCTEWNCGSSICVQCGQGLGSKEEDFIYFKVVAMEPSDERFLRVHHSQTALVLGGTVSCGLPPDLLVSSSKANMPLQVDTVNVLASVLSPPLCPSALSSKLRVAVLLHGLPGCGKRTVVNYVAKRLGLHVVEYSCHSLLASSEKKTSTALAQTFNMARRYAPTILLLRHFEVFKNLGSQDGSQGDRVGVASEIASIIRELTEPVSNGEYSSMEENSNSNSSVDEGGKFRGHQVLLIASSESTEGLSPTIRRCFSHEIRMGSLNDEQRSELLSQSLQDVSQLLNTSSDEFVKELVGQTSGFLPRDLRALVADAGANLFISKESETEKIDSLSGDVDQSSQLGNGSERLKAKDDFTKALDRSKKRNASALGAPKVPNVKWDDVGGLEDVKSSILDTVQLPLLHKDLFSSGLRKRSGVLLYGPPGTGKTLLAKAVATECSLNFLSVKGPELINMYIGESEKNVRDIFEKARSARPCVIFFDELDSLAPARGASGDSGGVMDRVVSQMLAEIDGLSDSSQDLFIIGASNRPDLIDPALLRPGRFDKLLYVGVNADASYRERVLKALTRKFKLSEDVSLYLVAKKCPSTFTGADMYALCADAWFQAAKRKVLNSDSGDDSIPEDDPDSVVVEFIDFIKMISVSSSDARNEIGLGFGGGIEEEEDMEMEEDEEEESTHSYVSCVDPDVALSYIDEKLENVLGHFQKDFEGGVSAENLGAKYGGYGSFLSMYQRSPACKSPPQAQNQVVGQSKCSDSPSKAGSTSKAPPASSDVLAKMKNLVKSSNDSKQKPVTKTSPSSAPSNHKTLKLRIKVGSKSDLSLKNVTTYDGKQGLNMMPPSEVEEGLLIGTHDSPTKILMAMVSFPFHKDQLLSPLSDDLIQLGKKGNIMKDALRCVKKEKLKYMPPPSNRLDGSHIVSDTDREVDKESCEELVSKTMKLPLLSCLSPSSIHRAKEIDKISDSYVEGALRGMNNTDLDAALMGSKPELEDDVVAFPDQSVEGTESVNTRKDMEEGEHVDPVVKVSKTWNEEQILKPKLPKAQKSRKSSSRNGLRGKDAAVNVVNTNLPDKLQEDIGDSGESKEQEQSSLVPKGKEEKLSEESAVKESFNGVRNVEEAWKCEPDSKHPIKWSDLNKDGDNTKESVRSEVTNKHSVVIGMEPERDLCKKPKTGKSRFSALDQPGSNKTMKDTDKPSPHEDRKRKQKENKESGDCIRDAAVLEPSGEKVRKQKRLKGSSCEGKELPESCDRYRVVTQENGRDSASHQPLVHEAKGSLVDSLAPSALDPPELKSERISERDKPNDTDSSAGDTRKRCRDGEGYITMDKPGTTKKAAESLRDNKEGYCTESEPQQEKAKESRNKKRPARKVSMESNKEDSSREHQDPINKRDNTNSTKTKVMRHDDHVGSSPLKKEITSQAASNSIKEATDLKHIADRLKNAGNNHESIGFYFQAALKFLHGASLLESSGTENATHKSIVTSKHIYGSTAKLCKFCAHEYEKDKDMGAAALAYKCMEVAYLRITYSSHGNINRYKSELEASLQVIPSGESPSFASDGENPNKTLAAEKVALSTPVRSSPKVTGNHVLSSGNNSSLSQLLTFSQNVSLAMDASRKAQTAFAVAKGKSSDTRYSSNGITCIKRALDFSFQDMEKLVHAVRLAMESINR
ncbi:unnamed protein product [Brassica rapa]|uniref:Peroxisomal ATPase PEX6 n=2 Tax=Brassica TaxID=3705 RepID=A0A8D9G4E5_BRACM|nr:unnamed protein product [Brassica rapa]